MHLQNVFFFNLEKKFVHNNLIHCLCMPDGSITSDPLMMRRTAFDFYTELFAKEDIGLDTTQTFQ